jgi:hypothetical protein
MLLNTKNNKSLSLLNRKVKLGQLMQLHTKNNMSCSPRRQKARLVETITEQRNEHLTEEEKKISAQIRSVASTLYERVDLNKPTVEIFYMNIFTWI